MLSLVLGEWQVKFRLPDLRWLLILMPLGYLSWNQQIHSRGGFRPPHSLSHREQWKRTLSLTGSYGDHCLTEPWTCIWSLWDWRHGLGPGPLVCFHQGIWLAFWIRLLFPFPDQGTRGCDWVPLGLFFCVFSFVASFWWTVIVHSVNSRKPFPLLWRSWHFVVLIFLVPGHLKAVSHSLPHPEVHLLDFWLCFFI